MRKRKMKKNFVKKLVTGILAAALGVTALAGCGSAKGNDQAKGDQVYRTLDEIKDSGEINIGVFSDKNPFGYVDDNGDYQGYDVYFAERLGKDLGVKINYVSTEAANRVEYLETGKVDIILANFTVTDERAEKVDFASSYMNVALGVVSHEDNVIESLDQIGADDQVIVISGTTAETYLEKNYPDIKLQKFDTYAAAKTAFENGTGVAWANDNTEVIAYAQENPGYIGCIGYMCASTKFLGEIVHGYDTYRLAILLTKESHRSGLLCFVNGHDIGTYRNSLVNLCIYDILYLLEFLCSHG